MSEARWGCNYFNVRLIWILLTCNGEKILITRKRSRFGERICAEFIKCQASPIGAGGQLVDLRAAQVINGMEQIFV